jgi:hypothetical protein
MQPRHTEATVRCAYSEPAGECMLKTRGSFDETTPGADACAAADAASF